MNAIPLGFPEVILLKPKVFADERGFFYGSFNQNAFQEVTNEFERTITWNDPTIGIDWPIDLEPLLLTKDRQGLSTQNTKVLT